MLDRTPEMDHRSTTSLAGHLTGTASAVAVALALALLACGGSGSSTTPAASTTRRVSASAGATLTAGAATLTIPPGALASDTDVTVREAEPHHAGRASRIEIEPHEALAAGADALLAVVVTEDDPKVTMHDGSTDSPEDVEVEDRNHASFKTHMSSLDDVEVEVEHGLACDPACAAGQECDDGVCKAHDGAAKTCSSVCDSGQECDDGVCKTHDEVEVEHGGMAGSCSPSCATGMVCHEGVCKTHG